LRMKAVIAAPIIGGGAKFVDKIDDLIGDFC
jgi:hypothetical protein